MARGLLVADVQVLGDLLGDSLVMAFACLLACGDLVDLSAAGVDVEEADRAGV